jgi:hypothetical protein
MPGLGFGVKPDGADQGGDLSNIWNVVLAGVPYGLGVASFNIGKHIDKHDEDKATGGGKLCSQSGSGCNNFDLCRDWIPGLCAALFHACDVDRFPCVQARADSAEHPRPAQPLQAGPPGRHGSPDSYSSIIVSSVGG